MAFQLVVVNAFGEYAKGDTITDQQAIDAILAGEQADSVVKVAAPEPKPKKA
ncbi:hypothetical protein [Chitinimonas naiadis]